MKKGGMMNMHATMKYFILIAFVLSVVFPVPILAHANPAAIKAVIHPVRHPATIKAIPKPKPQTIATVPPKPQAAPVAAPAPAPAPAPVPTPKPQPVAASMPGQCQSYRSIVSQYGWDVTVAMAIMQAESQCYPVTADNSAINYDHVPDYGLFQLHGIPITDPAANVAYAYYHKYLTQGWHAWSTYNSGAYLKYL